MDILIFSQKYVKAIPEIFVIKLTDLINGIYTTYLTYTKKNKICELNHSNQNSKHNQYFRMQYFRTKKLHIQQGDLLQVITNTNHQNNILENDYTIPIQMLILRQISGSQWNWMKQPLKYVPRRRLLVYFANTSTNINQLKKTKTLRKVDPKNFVRISSNTKWLLMSHQEISNAIFLIL